MEYSEYLDNNKDSISKSLVSNDSISNLSTTRDYCNLTINDNVTYSYYDKNNSDDIIYNDKQSGEDSRLIVGENDLEAQINNKSDVNYFICAERPELFNKVFWMSSNIIMYLIVLFYAFKYYKICLKYSYDVLSPVVAAQNSYIGNLLISKGVLNIEKPGLYSVIILNIITFFNLKNPVFYLVLFPIAFMSGKWANKKGICIDYIVCIYMLWFYVKMPLFALGFFKFYNLLLSNFIITPVFAFVHGYYYETIINYDFDCVYECFEDSMCWIFFQLSIDYYFSMHHFSYEYFIYLVISYGLYFLLKQSINYHLKEPYEFFI